MSQLDWNLIVLASVLIIFLYLSLKYIQKPKKMKMKAEKRPPEITSHLETTPSALDVSPSKTPQMDELSSIDKGSIYSGEEMVDKDSTPEDELFAEKEPIQMVDKPILYVKKVIPEFTLKPQTHSLSVLNKIKLENLGTTPSMWVKGSIEYKLKDKSLTKEALSSNVTLGPKQSIIIENSFHLPLNEIQYIKIANIIKNKQSLEVPDVKPLMKMDIQYEGENGEVFDIVQSYQFDFKRNSWGLYIKGIEESSDLPKVF